jgi:hypothetical protein
MSESRHQALAEARKRVRTLGSAPDPRAQAQAVLSALRPGDGWSSAARAEIAATDAWLKAGPSPSMMEPRLRALLAKLGSA